MAQQTINVGTAPNDGTGTPLRTAFQYTNSNFTELYTATGPSGNNINVPGAATITGNLTVDTNTFFVDSANNWVGFGTATPAVRVHSSVADAAEAARFSSASAMLRVHPYLDATDKTRIQATNGTNTGLSDLTLEGFNLRFNTNGGLAYTISNVGVSTWSNVGGVAGTAMTLNSTGLGVGVSPVAKIDSLVADAAECGRFRAASGWLRIHPYLDATDVCRIQSTNNTNTGLQTLTLEGINLRFNTNSGNAVIIDNLGNTVSNVNSAVPALGTNNRMVFNLTSNTNLRISVRGSDGVTRVANITLA